MHVLHAPIQKSLANGFDASFVISATSTDRIQDTISEDAYLPSLKLKKLIALFGHDHSKPVGYWSNFRLQAGKLVADLKLASTNLGQMIKQLIDDGVPLGASIGFRGKAEPNKEGGFHFSEIELFETSVVSVPAHPKAKLIAKNFGFQLSETPDGTEVVTIVKTDASKPKCTTKSRASTMNLSERILEKRKQIVELEKSLEEKTALIDDDEHDDSDGLLASEIVTISEQIEHEKSQLEALEKAESALKQRAKPISAPGTVKHPNLPESKKPAELMTKMATVQFLAHFERKNPMQVVEERYKNDSRVDAIIKSAVMGADTTTAGWAAELVRQDVQGFIEELRAVSVYGELASYGMGVDFGNAGSVVVPAYDSSSDLSGAFVGEQGVIPVKAGSVTSKTLNRYKMAVISVFSKEIARASTPYIESVIRERILRDTSMALDAALLDDNAPVAGVRPPGLGYNLGANSFAGAAGGGQAAVSADLRALMDILIASNAGARPVLIMSTSSGYALSLMTTQLGEYVFGDEVSQNRLRGIPIIRSTHVPADEVWLVDASYFAHAFAVPEFDVSDTATLTMANADGTAPTQATDGAGGLGTPEQVKPDGGISVVGGADSGVATAGYQAQSMFQTWQIAIRMVYPVSWAMVRDGVVAKATAITW